MNTRSYFPFSDICFSINFDLESPHNKTIFLNLKLAKKLSLDCPSLLILSIDTILSKLKHLFKIVFVKPWAYPNSRKFLFLNFLFFVIS